MSLEDDIVSLSTRCEELGDTFEDPVHKKLFSDIKAMLVELSFAYRDLVRKHEEYGREVVDMRERVAGLLRSIEEP